MKTNTNTAETTTKPFTRTVDAFEGMSTGQRIKEQEKDYRKTAMERHVMYVESLFGKKLSQKAYNDLLKFHLNHSPE